MAKRNTDRYHRTLEAIREGLAQGDLDADRLVEILHETFDHYAWIGIYHIDGNDLVLGPWRGPQATEHVRIPVGQGICGAAAASGRTEIIDDVDADTRYLACFASTRSEIVVPIRDHHRVIGEIDIDSDTPQAFDDADCAFLEAVADLLAPSLAGKN